MKTLGIFVGSLRKDSYSKQVADVLTEQLKVNYNTKYLEIGDLPLYNEDLETENPPVAWAKFREQLSQCDAFLFVTPEYNRSMPGALKNALDIGSRPYGTTCFTGKPAGIVSQSTGAMGGFGSNHHLRQSLTFLDVYPLQQPEIYLSKSSEMFDENGVMSDRSQRYLKSFTDALHLWIEKFN